MGFLSKIFDENRMREQNRRSILKTRLRSRLAGARAAEGLARDAAQDADGEPGVASLNNAIVARAQRRQRVFADRLRRLK